LEYIFHINNWWNLLFSGGAASAVSMPADDVEWRASIVRRRNELAWIQQAGVSGGRCRWQALLVWPRGVERRDARRKKAAQCAAFELVGPHGLEPWTKGL
jgi:hypothetical protein